jgi:hypothetical protein
LGFSEILKKKFPEENRKKLGHSLEDILFKCQYNNEPCSSRDFERNFDYFYGNCYTFNSGRVHDRIKKSFLAGNQFGLKLDVYANYNYKLNKVNTPFGPSSYLRIENGSSLSATKLDVSVILKQISEKVTFLLDQ